MIVGTAGHIDHGKSTLVRALTGVDTDRLREEKERGISIELGYASLPLDDALDGGPVLGFVDVPGHERLVRTMVAGASGIEFALLVVAADDGVMPQTREHVAILDLLGVGAGAVAIAKADRVDAARVERVRAEIGALLAPTALCRASMFALDARDPGEAGVRALREHLVQAARAARARRSDAFFRLAVDRVFSLAGHGTIVTGTVHAGEVHVGDSLLAMPAGLPVRVRGLHAQNREASTGRLGQRCALNLAGIEKGALSRGDWIADARALVASTRIDVRLRVLGATRAPWPDWTPVHVHLGTARRTAHVVGLDDAGADGSRRVQLVCDAPICACAGDRFIVRDAQARTTLGGGVVLDADAPARRRRSAERLAQLDAIERMLAGDGVAALVRAAPSGMRLAELERRAGRVLAASDLGGDARALGGGTQRLVIGEANWQALRDAVVRVLDAHHAAAPDDAGIDRGRLRRIAVPTLADDAWRPIVDELLREGAIGCRGPWLHRPGHRIEPNEAERALAARIEPMLLAARFDPPWVRDLALQLGAHEDDVRRTLRKVAAQGRCHQVVRDLFYADACMRELADVLQGLAMCDGPVGAAAFRDAIGLGRKRAIQILEFFDRVGYTRRVRDAHVLRGDSGWIGERDVDAKEGMRIR
ncbi:MAG: selenocysteine-specific translation elongation factor [Dokdonella sp.]|uniref:selenocysteine-specific translation elongation factor n=1 Tax=Dokdonella sp. TaxID=2291710 RepID=UPI003F7FD4C0